jgi:membrane-associated protein
MLGFDLVELIIGAGYAGLTAVVFAESGLLIGFFFPGDSLLFTAGFLASQDVFNIWLLIGLLFPAAVFGDSVGYAFGNRVGYRIFNRQDSLFFDKQNLIRAKNFFEKYGGKAVVLARFMPVVRTFVPILAGVGKMHYGRFLFFNIFGGFLWTVGITLLGFFLGRTIPNVDQYILPIVILIILASISPGIVHLIKEPAQRRRIIAHLKKHLEKKSK